MSMSDPINSLIEAVWEAHGDSEVWVKLANEANAENEALHAENDRLNDVAIQDEDLNGPPPSATQLREAIYRNKELEQELAKAETDFLTMLENRNQLSERAEKAEARVAKLQSVGAEAIKLLRVLAEFYDTADKLLQETEPQETPPDSDDYEGGGPG